MSIELNCKDGYNIEIEKKEDRINILLVENEAFGERILVGAEERKEFLTPWINMLMHHKKEAGIKGTMDLAKKLEHIVLFEKGKHEKGVLALKSINTEIINLRKEFQEKEEQVKIKKQTFKIVQKRLFSLKRRFCHSDYYPLFRAANKADLNN